MPGRNRLETTIVLAAAGAGVVLLAVLGLWIFVSATASPIHPRPAEAPSVVHTPPHPEWTAAVGRARPIVRQSLAEQNLPGLSVAVGVDGTMVWAEGFGWADLDERVPVSPDTTFRIGTASIALTSAAVGLLAEEGRLTLDEDVQRLVPEYPPKAWPVTIRQLMGHTAGVADDGGDEGPLFEMRCERPIEGLQPFVDWTLIFEPGTAFRSSNYGWILVSAAVEAAADEPFMRVMRKRVFEPLGMDDTGPDTGPESNPERAVAYFPRFAADPRYGPDPMRPVDLSCYAGAAAFVSTPSDLVRFGMGVVSGTFLRPDTVEQLQTPQVLRDGRGTGYGLGWAVETLSLAGAPARMAGHEGRLQGGPVASLMTFPEHGLVVAVIANTSYADTSAVALGVAQAFVDEMVRRSGR